MSSGMVRPEGRVVRAARALSVPWLAGWYSVPENRVESLRVLFSGGGDLGPVEDVGGEAFLVTLMHMDQDFCWEVIGVLKGVLDVD